MTAQRLDLQLPYSTAAICQGETQSTRCLLIEHQIEADRSSGIRELKIKDNKCLSALVAERFAQAQCRQAGSAETQAILI